MQMLQLPAPDLDAAAPPGDSDGAGRAALTASVTVLKLAPSSLSLLFYSFVLLCC